MKVFVPVSDEVLDEKGGLSGKLVPFDPEYLSAPPGAPKEGHKPANWISDADYASACERLRQQSVTGSRHGPGGSKSRNL